MRPPYHNKDWPDRRTRTARHYNGAPLALHRVPDTEREFCAFSDCGGVEIYVLAGSRQEAKQRAQAKTPSHYRTLSWRK